MGLNPPNIKLIVAEDYDQMSVKAAQIIADVLLTKPDAVLGFATGTTPVGLYAELVARYKSGELCFARATSFNLDEYLPISRENECSYHNYMHRHLFSHINIRREHIHIPDGQCADGYAECAAYEANILAAGGIDIQLLGIGLNGHIAFNEPAAYFPGGTHIVELAESTVEANRRFFSSSKDMPHRAITMGVGTIVMAKRLVLIASGIKKAGIVCEAIFGNVHPGVPASILQFHPNVTVVLDKAAAQGLRTCI